MHELRFFLPVLHKQVCVRHASLGVFWGDDLGNPRFSSGVLPQHRWDALGPRGMRSSINDAFQ